MSYLNCYVYDICCLWSIILNYTFLLIKEGLFVQIWAMSHSSFGEVPPDLLLSTVKHPHLTVDRLVYIFLFLEVGLNLL